MKMQFLAAALVLAVSAVALADTQTIDLTATNENGRDNGTTWTADSVNLSATFTPGFSFAAVTEIPAGSTIDSAYFAWSCTYDDTSGLTALIEVEDADPSTNTIFQAGHLASAATTYTGTSTGSVNYSNGIRYLGFGNTGATNIGAQIQSLLDEYGTIEVGHRININLDHTAGSTEAGFEQYGAAGTNHATLLINWTPPAGGSAVPAILQQH